MLSRRGFLKGALGTAAAGIITTRANAQSYSPSYSWDRVTESPAVIGTDGIRSAMASNRTDPVCVQLILMLDASGSMNDSEFAIQRDAHVAAFMPSREKDEVTGRSFSNIVEAAIRLKKDGQGTGIAVTVVEFGNRVSLRIPWTDFRGDDPDLKDKLEAFAYTIRTTPRSHSGSSTNIGGGLTFCHALFANCPWKATQSKVIDVSHDGRADSTPANLMQSRDLHAVNGVTINALTIVNEVRDLDHYAQSYLVTQQSVQGPDGIWSIPGRVWTIARNMRTSDNSPNVLTELSREVERALKLKISVEVADADTVRDLLKEEGMERYASLLPMFEPGTAALTSPEGHFIIKQPPNLLGMNKQPASLRL